MPPTNTAECRDVGIRMLPSTSLNCSWTASFEALSPDKDENKAKHLREPLVRGFMGRGSKPRYAGGRQNGWQMFILPTVQIGIKFRLSIPHWNSIFRGGKRMEAKPLNMCLSALLTRVIHDLATVRLGCKIYTQLPAS